MAESIKDKVAIIGVGCTKFGNVQEKSINDLIVEACYEACEDSKVDLEDIMAAWIGFVFLGGTGQTLTIPVKPFQYKNVTHVDAGGSTGLAALRCAAYGVLSKVFDVALAVGVERTTAFGWQGYPPFPLDGSCHAGLRDSFAGANVSATSAGHYAALATRYFYKYGLSPEEGKKMLAMLSLKSFRNGKLNPRAYLQRELSLDEVLEAPIIAWPLGVFDCSDTTDGAAAAIIVRAEDAKKFRPDPILIKALEFDVASDDRYTTDSDFAHVEASYRVASKAYEVAGVKNPRQEISVAEIDDVFSIAEAVSLEDLQFSPRGKVKENIESGIFNLDGKLPVQPDGGARCFGDAIGATNLRQTYEICLQLQGRANGRQIANPKLGLIHTIGSLVEPTSPNASCAILGL